MIEILKCNVLGCDSTNDYKSKIIQHLKFSI